MAERLIAGKPRIDKVAYTVYLTYQTEDIPSATVIIPVDFIPEKQLDQFAKEFNAKKGKLYEKYVNVRKSTLKEDLERRRATAPSVIEV